MPLIGQIQASDLAVPYWRNEKVSVYLGDCLTVMPNLPDGCVDLCFADPPFNRGLKYDNYNDNREDYILWCSNWIDEVYRLCRDRASFYLATGIKYQAFMFILGLQAGFIWQDTIVWHYTFGPAQESKFTPSWVAIHYFTKGEKGFTWNPDEIRVPSARQLKYNDKRANPAGKLPDNVWILSPREELTVAPDSNVWIESRICGTFKERTTHPCQMPLPLLERIVKVSSNPGDLVLDPFLGSGTTAVASASLGRKCIGIELSENYLKDCCISRLEKL